MEGGVKRFRILRRGTELVTVVEADYVITEPSWIKFCRRSRDVPEEMGRVMVLQILSADNVDRVVCEDGYGE